MQTLTPEAKLKLRIQTPVDQLPTLRQHSHDRQMQHKLPPKFSICAASIFGYISCCFKVSSVWTVMLHFIRLSYNVYIIHWCKQYMKIMIMNLEKKSVTEEHHSTLTPGSRYSSNKLLYKSCNQCCIKVCCSFICFVTILFAFFAKIDPQTAYYFRKQRAAVWCHHSSSAHVGRFGVINLSHRSLTAVGFN